MYNTNHMKQIVLAFALLSIFSSFNTDLPVVTYKGTGGKPLVLYISGDGGWNSFSTSFVAKLNKEGFNIVGLNARTYFWNKKQPQQAANDIGGLMKEYQQAWNLKNVVLIGYSFGADVMPFIHNRLEKQLVDQVKHVVLMSPSNTTDFEVHLLGGYSGESVPAEINKLKKPATIIIGAEESDFLLQKITAGSIRAITLPGGHHYDGNVDAVVKTVMECVK